MNAIVNDFSSGVISSPNMKTDARDKLKRAVSSISLVRKGATLCTRGNKQKADILADHFDEVIILNQEHEDVVIKEIHIGKFSK